MVIPDGRVGWYFDSVNVGKKILGENKIDAIFSSGSSLYNSFDC